MIHGPADEPRLFTIGHSNHDIAHFLRLLQEAGVTAIADVRSSPFSQWRPQFNRPELEQTLRQYGIAYVFLGEYLGGRPKPAHLYDADGRVDYERVRNTGSFHQGLDQLTEGIERFRIALMCAEEDPLDCHRGLMITPALQERGISPFHLRGDGSVESTPDMEQRLLDQTGVGAGILDGLFAATLAAEERQQFLAEAYRLQARRRAFSLRSSDPAADTWG